MSDNDPRKTNPEAEAVEGFLEHHARLAGEAFLAGLPVWARLPAPSTSRPESASARRSGPITTLAAVEEARDRLIADGKPHGYRSIAKAGGWSVATVRRRLSGN
jgi:hypothetical protein